MLVLKQVVVATMNVKPMRSVTLLQAVALLAKNVNHSVTLAIVTLVLIVLLRTIRKLVDVGHP